MIFFYGIGILCLIYFVIVALLTQLNSLFHLIWIGIGICFVAIGRLIGLQMEGRIAIPTWVWGLGGLLLIVLCVFWMVMIRIIYGHAAKKPSPGAAYLIILGAQVKGDKPSLALLCRVKVALSYIEENPDTKVIPSGARGRGETITEARCMEEWLISHGVNKEKILLEEGSFNTDENIAFCGNMIGDKNQHVVIATSTFHTFRAVAIAKKQGFTHVEGIGAENNRIMLPSYYLRESMAVIKYKLQGRI